MKKRNFIELLRAKWLQEKFLCVGIDIEYNKIPIGFLDEHLGKMPIHIAKLWTEKVIDETKDIVCAYKPNIAFFEAHGIDGWEWLRHIFGYILQTAPDVPVILDFKRGDIASTNAMYATAAFEQLNADAVTVSPYLGSETMTPFLSKKDKGVIVLCRTSNPGAGELQDLMVVIEGESNKPLYQIVAKTVLDKWNYNNNCLLVVGATYPDEIGIIRNIAPSIPLLIPGIGKQGGDLKKVLEVAFDKNGEGVIINASSSIVHSLAPGKEASDLHESIIAIRKKIILNDAKV